MLASATCGSDVHGWYVTRKLPAVLGHELVGEVVEAGAGVTRVAPGDVVAIHHHSACGACRVCASGHETLCPRFRATRLDPGGFAEHVRIQPELVGELLPLDGLDPVAATCTEPLACALRAQDRVGLAPRDTLLVAGAGTSGLLHVAAARARGVERVLVAEPRADRRERALAWGAAAFEPGEPVDVAIVTSHRAEAIAAAAAALGPGGRLCAYAPPEPGAPIAVDGSEVFLRELTVTSSWSAGSADMRAALALLRVGRGPDRRADHAPLRAGGDRSGARGAARRQRAEGGRAALGRAVMRSPDDGRCVGRATMSVLAFVRSALPPPPARVLEVGAGDGELAAALLAAGYDVVAIDPAPAAMRSCAPSRCSTSMRPRRASTPPSRSCRSTTSSRSSRRARISASSSAAAAGSSSTSSTSARSTRSPPRGWCARRRELGREAPHDPAGMVGELRDHLHAVERIRAALSAPFELERRRARSLPAPLGPRSRARARRAGGDRGRTAARRRRPLHGRAPLSARRHRSPALKRRCSRIRRESQIASRPSTTTGTTRWPVSASTSSRSPRRHGTRRSSTS